MIDVAADRARITEQSVADALGDAPHHATVVSEWLAQYAASAKPTLPLVPPGAPLLVVARALGHATTRMTEMHYAHLSPNFEDPVVTQLRKR